MPRIKRSQVGRDAAPKGQPTPAQPASTASSESQNDPSPSQVPPNNIPLLDTADSPIDAGSPGNVPLAEGQSVGDPAKTVFALRLALVVVSIVAIGLIVTVILLLTRGNGPASGTTSPQPNASAATTQEATPMYLTQYIAVDSGATKEDAIIIELHTDYQCPWCGRAEQIYGEALHDLAISGDVDLRIHLRTLVGDQIIGNDSSRRAAAAAVCANDVDAFWAYHSTIFANQPEEGVGFTDEQLLVDFPAQAGISGQALQDFQTCYQSGASQEQVQAMEDEGSQAGINGTPAFYVNGLPVNFDLQPSADSITSMNATDLLAALQNL